MSVTLVSFTSAGDRSRRQYTQSGDFKLAMQAAGLSSAELARRLDVHPNTVSRWSTGVTEPGPGVMAYLELYAKVKSLVNG